MTGMEVGFTGAVLAGLLSFLSPCVLPLVPPYLCFLSGASIEQLSREGDIPPAVTRRVLFASIAFVAGFATIFVALGATASALGQMVSDHLDLLGQIAGVVIIVLGLHFLGVFRIALLFRDARFDVAGRPAGLIGAYIVGLAFAFGWTPCVGPILAAILMIAASESTALHGAALLGAYSAGIGIPFVAAAFAVRPFLGFMQRFRRHLGRIEKAIGILLVATGVLFVTGGINDIAFWLLETFPALGRVG